MKKIMSLVFTLLIIFSCTDENFDAVKSQRGAEVEKLNSGNDLVGYISKDNLTKSKSHDSWFTPQYKDYSPNRKKLTYLKTALQNVEIRFFMSTWALESRELTPKVCKIFDQMNFKNFKMIALDRDLKYEGIEEDYNIQNVPTLIFYKDKKEIGRFVAEVKKESLEEDFLIIAVEGSY